VIVFRFASCVLRRGWIRAKMLSAHKPLSNPIVSVDPNWSTTHSHQLEHTRPPTRAHTATN
jgi:hypothetical protein